MKVCDFCGADESNSVIYKGIHKNSGFVNICNSCYKQERIPLVAERKVEERQEDQKRESVRKRLERMARYEKRVEQATKSSPYDNELRKLVEKNSKEEEPIEHFEKPDLIENFHWVIMRKRRGLKMTRGEFAHSIQEPEGVIESLENAKLTRNYVETIKKIENKLGINLFKKRILTHEDIIAESKVPGGIIVSELKPKKKGFFSMFNKIDSDEVSVEKIEEILGKPVEPKKDLSDKEVDDLIWKK